MEKKLDPIELQKFRNDMADFLSRYQDKREDLADLIYSIQNPTFLDNFVEAFTEIDPFSFMAFFNTAKRWSNSLFFLVKDLCSKDSSCQIRNPFSRRDDCYEKSEENALLEYFWYLFFDPESSSEEQEEAIDNLWNLFEQIRDLDLPTYLADPNRDELVSLLVEIRKQKFTAQKDGNVPDQPLITGQEIADEIYTGLRWFCPEDLVEQLENDVQLMENGQFCISYYPDIITEWKNARNIILHGAPGTGKTYLIPELIVEFCRGANTSRQDVEREYQALVDTDRVAFTTFHQSMDYEDFVEGIRPDTDPDSEEGIGYQIKDGIFKRICEEADQNRELPYFLVIDEINRGNVSKIFGELITLIEKGKRSSSTQNGIEVLLPYSMQPFQVPENLYIIATMNTADRSLGRMDYALKRRFGIIPVLPHVISVENGYFDEELFHEVSSLFVKDCYCDCVEDIERSDYLSDFIDPEDVWLGQSYFIMEDDSAETRLRKIRYEIVPVLKDYLKDNIFKTKKEAGERINQLYSIGKMVESDE